MHARIAAAALVTALAAATLGGGLTPFAGAAQAGELRPALPPAKGDKCVEDTEVMRRRHMEFILHQRDRTVHEGIRTAKHRFTNCIDCHVRPDAAGRLPRHTEAGHFCTACHVYSAVSIDCFQCHADRPAAETAAR